MVCKNKIIVYSCIILLFTAKSMLFSQSSIKYYHFPKISSAYERQDSILVCTPSIALRESKIIVFLGGTNSKSSDFAAFAKSVSSTGYVVIVLPYRNSVSTLRFWNAKNIREFDYFHEEICFGKNVSDSVSVDIPNSIVYRLFETLGYLQKNVDNYFSEFVLSRGIDWKKVILIGHSQGGGHASYIAKYYPVDKVILLSSPNDYSHYHKRPALWLTEKFATSANRFYQLVHLKDETVDYRLQLENASSMRIPNALSPYLINSNLAPVSLSNCLITSNTDSSYTNHLVTVLGVKSFSQVWNYFVSTSNLITSTSSSTEVKDPAIEVLWSNNNLMIKVDESTTLQIFDIIGRNLLSASLSKGINYYPTYNYRSSVYFVRVGSTVRKIIIEK